MISCKKLKGFIKEESMASKEYDKLGFISQAKDEARHASYFKKMAKRCR